MKEKSKYHIRDYFNIVLFFAIFLCFFISSIIGIVQLSSGEIEASKLIFRILLTFSMCLPYIIKKIFRFSISKVVTIVIYLHIFLAGFLGVVLEFYTRLEWWDMLIHFLMGVWVSVFSIFILNASVYKKDNSKHNLAFTFTFMIMFAVFIGAMWEIGEFVADNIFKTAFQRYISYEGVMFFGQKALVDTMIDLIMDTLGGVVGVVFVVIVMKFSSKFLKTFKIKKLKKLEEEVENIEE